VATSVPRAIPIWFPLAVLALLIAWPTADRVRAARHDAQLVVADLRADELLLVDVGQAAVIDRIPMPGGAHELLELPDHRVLVSIEQAGRLALVDLETGSVLEIPIGGTPHGLAFDGEVVFVTDRDADEVRRFHLSTWEELDPIPTGRWPHAVVLTSDGSIAVAAALDDAIVIGDQLVAVSGLPETVDIAPDGAIAAAGAVGGELHILAPDGSEELRISLGGRPVRVRFAPDGESVAVALSASGEVARVGRDGQLERVPVPGVPDGLAFSRSGDELYVSDVVGGGITVLRTSDLSRIAVIEGGTATGALLVR
jgi:DNA-binding beta-propeller fold protein YncE